MSLKRKAENRPQYPMPELFLALFCSQRRNPHYLSDSLLLVVFFFNLVSIFISLYSIL